jgi:hypothetical protein
VITPSRSAALAFLLFVVTGCAAQLPIKRVPGTFAFPTRGELNVERRFVVRSNAEWERQWAQILPKLYDGTGRYIRSEPPPINFSREMILIAEMGLKGSGGFEVDIRRVRDRGTFLQAEVWQFSPDPRCHVVADNENPTDIVRVPASSKPIRWSVINRVRDCYATRPA